MSLGVVVHSISGRFVWPDDEEDPTGSEKDRAIENLVAFAAAGLFALVDEEKRATGSPRGTSR
jgi:hypothetical protein